MKNAVILLGLPCAGKTTWISENKDTLPKDFVIVSADKFKESHIEYNPKLPSKQLHEWSVAKAETVIGNLSDAGQNIVFDSGSINNRYTIRILTMLKAKGYIIKLVHIKTPYIVCLERNSLRDRKVPEQAITDKALKETSQFHKLEAMADETIIIDYFSNKNIFVDMDGIIAAQSTLPIINNEIDFTNGEIHKWQKPVTQVIDKLINLYNRGYTLYILSAVANSIAYDEKQEWLDKNFNIPREKRFFVNRGLHKAEMLDNLRRKFKLKHTNVLLLDDVHETLYKVKARGMNAMHISEFLTYNF